MASGTEPRSRRLGRLLVAGALAAAALATPACGGDGAAEPPSRPGGAVDPAASTGMGGAVNRAKDVADAADRRTASLEPATPAGSDGP